MNQLIEWWPMLNTAEQTFTYIGLIFNGLFIIYVLFSFLGAEHDDTIDPIDADYGALFPILSIRGILAFGMFMGWTALVISRAGFIWPIAAVAGTVAGWGAAWLAWKMLHWMMRWQASGNLMLTNAIGKEGEVYLPLPDAGQGNGKVLVEIQGALREMDAATTQTAIPTGTKVVITGIDETTGCLLVTPVGNPHIDTN